MSQDSRSEEDFALTHSEQVVIQLQSFDLNKDTTFISGKETATFSAMNVCILQVGNISNHQFRCLLAIHEGTRNRIGS